MKTQPAKPATNGQIEESQWKQYRTDFHEPQRQSFGAAGDFRRRNWCERRSQASLLFTMASFEEKGSDKGDVLLLTLGGTNADDTNQIMHVVANVASISPQVESNRTRIGARNRRGE